MYVGIRGFSNYFRPRVGKLWHVSQIQLTTCFCKKNKIKKAKSTFFGNTALPIPLRIVHNCFYAAKLQRQRRVGRQGPCAPRSLKDFTIWPFTEKQRMFVWRDPGCSSSWLTLCTWPVLSPCRPYSLVTSTSFSSFRLIKELNQTAQVSSLLGSLPWSGTWVQIPPQHSGFHVLETHCLIVEWVWTRYLSTVSPSFPSVKWGW